MDNPPLDPPSPLGVGRGGRGVEADQAFYCAYLLTSTPLPTHSRPMLSILWFVVAAQGVVIVGGAVMYLRRSNVAETRSETPQSDDSDIYDTLVIHESLLAGLKAQIEGLTLAVAEGVENVARAERRVRQVVTRAKKRLRDAGFEDEALDAEAEDLPQRNAEVGGQIGLPDMPDDVEGNADTGAYARSVIPGRF